jgi:hypothetical protein
MNKKDRDHLISITLTDPTAKQFGLKERLSLLIRLSLVRNYTGVL